MKILMPTATALLAGLMLLALPSGEAALLADHPLVQEVVFDVTKNLDLSQLTFAQPCEFNVAFMGLPVPSTPSQRLVLLPAQHGFRFEETNAGRPVAPGDPPGYDAHGCGIVSLNATIPAGTSHIHVRFDASREASVKPNSIQSQYGARFQQELALIVPTGTAVRADFFNVSDSSHGPTLIDLEPPLYPGSAQSVQVNWTFKDRGSDVDTSVTKIYEGGAYASTITNVSIEFSGIAIPGRIVTESDVRAGTSVSHEVRVAVAITPEMLEGQDTDLRIRFDPSVSFTKVITPNGTDITDRSTRFGAGPTGFDHTRVLLERVDDYTQITVPGPLLRAHGAGTYTLVETLQSDVHAVPYLIPFALALLLIPFPFAAVAFRKIRVFEREAFGGFRRSARDLRFALVAAVLYYLIVLGAAFFGGRLAVMANWPLNGEAAFLYAQVLLAGAAFVALWFVARELYNITVPKVASKDET